MSTRRDITQINNSEPLGFEGNDTPGDIEIPPCTVEDVDRSVFNLFDKQLPFQAKTNSEGIKRIPVIFATGERFAVLRRKEPLRDKTGAIILPLISIMRSGINQDPDNGISGGQTSPIVIKRRLSRDNPIYKRLINENRLKNQDENADASHNLTPVGGGAFPGTIGSRRAPQQQTSDSRIGNLLKPQLSNNIYETLTIPPVKYYTATYNITFWSQYTQEMNNMLMTIMSLYQNNHRRTFKLETDKGYWFVGYASSELNPENNTDDFKDQERIIKCSFEIKVNAYIIAPQYPGSPSYIRRYVSAPTIEFDTFSTIGKIIVNPQTVQRNDPNVFVLEDLYSESNDLPDTGDASSIVNSLNNHLDNGPATVGGYSNKASLSSVRTVVTDRNIFTGEERENILTIKTVNPRKGETVYREQLIQKIEDIT